MLQIISNNSGIIVLPYIKINTIPKEISEIQNKNTDAFYLWIILSHICFPYFNINMIHKTFFEIYI